MAVPGGGGAGGPSASGCWCRAVGGPGGDSGGDAGRARCGAGSTPVAVRILLPVPPSCRWPLTLQKPWFVPKSPHRTGGVLLPSALPWGPLRHRDSGRGTVPIPLGCPDPRGSSAGAESPPPPSTPISPTPQVLPSPAPRRPPAFCWPPRPRFRGQPAWRCSEGFPNPPRLQLPRKDVPIVGTAGTPGWHRHPEARPPPTPRRPQAPPGSEPTASRARRRGPVTRRGGTTTPQWHQGRDGARRATAEPPKSPSPPSPDQEEGAAGLRGWGLSITTSPPPRPQPPHPPPKALTRPPTRGAPRRPGTRSFGRPAPAGRTPRPKSPGSCCWASRGW